MRIDRDAPLFIGGRRGLVGVAFVAEQAADGELRGITSEHETV